MLIAQELVTTQNLNANISACMESATHFGWTHYVNVCSGKVYDVPWGGVDWVLGVGFAGLGMLAVAALVFMLFAMAFDIARG